jgi:hypothetical protein
VLDVDAVVLDKNFKTISYENTLPQLFSNENEYFRLYFSKVKIAFTTDKFVMLPEKTDDASPVFAFMGMDISSTEIVLFDKIAEEQYIYYTLPVDVHKFFINRFKNLEWHFGDLALLKFTNPKLSFANHLAAHLAGNDLTIVLKYKNKALYFNKFYIQEKQDLLYFLKLAYKELNLDANQFATYLYGFIEEKSPMYTFSFGYIRNFEIDRTLKFGFDYLFSYDDYPLHYYYNLLALGKL